MLTAYLQTVKLGYRDSNPECRNQNPVTYRLAIAQCFFVREHDSSANAQLPRIIARGLKLYRMLRFLALVLGVTIQIE